MWEPDPTRLEEAAAWCEAHDLAPAVLLGPGADADALRRAGWAPTHAFVLDEDDPPPEGPVGPPLPWDRAASVAHLLAATFGRPEAGIDLAPVLAAAMAEDTGIHARLGFDGRDPVAALVGYDDTRAHLTLLEAGPSAHLRREAYASARAHGRRAARLLPADPATAAGALLQRWERPA